MDVSSRARAGIGHYFVSRAATSKSQIGGAAQRMLIGLIGVLPAAVVALFIDQPLRSMLLVLVAGGLLRTAISVAAPRLRAAVVNAATAGVLLVAAAIFGALGLSAAVWGGAIVAAVTFGVAAAAARLVFEEVGATRESEEPRV